MANLVIIFSWLYLTVFLRFYAAIDANKYLSLNYTPTIQKWKLMCYLFSNLAYLGPYFENRTKYWTGH